LATGTVSDVLLPHISFDAAHDSSQRESEHASTCQEGTRKDVINRISNWVERNPDYLVCWLEGPAGSGKSTIAHTIAEQCADKSQLAFSFFFSRGKPGRSDTSTLFPTFAYQLASSVPAIQALMQRPAVAADSSIPSKRLRHQIKKLIVDPISTVTEPVASLIVIIDGLDECGGDVGLVQELIQLLVETTAVHRLPFRFLFVSRPEAHIQQTFQSSQIRGKTYRLALQDFDARDDVRDFLRLRLSEIRDVQDDLMRGVPRPWPSQQDLEVLVNQSEGLFIYVSTLAKFVADRNGLPLQKLQAVMRAHTGVDPLYDQVLSEARMFDQFDRVVGAVMFLRDKGPSLTVWELEQFLQLQSGGVRLALRGCQSILVIPDDDKESVRPYHASLWDFLIDPDRAKHHFFNPMMHHVFMLVNCGKLIMASLENDVNDGNHLGYACQNWCHHFLHILLNGGDNNDIESHFQDWTSFVLKMQQQWLKCWIRKLERKEALETVWEDLCSALEQVKVSGLCQEFTSPHRLVPGTGGSSSNKQPE
jgi:hypothetical protein